MNIYQLWLGGMLLGFCSATLAEPAVVATAEGLVAGAEIDGVIIFKGIAYAEAPTGTQRWQAPQPRAPHVGVFQADRQGTACLQTLAANSTLVTSEDCLNLNIWTPGVGGPARPVMVWIHGGGLRAGSNDVAGEVFAQRGQVVVAINYRLGPLGFFAHDALADQSANPAIADMVLALQWVAENIAAFGGDPNNVTIFGVSAGGMAVNLLMVTAAAEGLFHRAIAQSGYATWALPRSRSAAPSVVRDMDGSAARSAEALAAALVAKVDPQVQTLSDLQALDGQMLVDAVEGFTLPIVDGISLPEEPGLLFQAGRQHAVPYMTGGNSYEGSVMPASGISPDQFADSLGKDLALAQQFYAADFSVSREQGLSRLFGDNRYLLSAAVLGGAMQKVDASSWLYYVDFVPPSQTGKWIGTPHGMDAYLLFNGQSSEETVTRALVTRMGDYWSNFASSGNPNGPGLLKWPAYRSTADQWLVFGASDEVRAGVLAEKLEWLQLRYRQRTHP